MKESYNIRENINGANYCYFHPKEFLVGVCPLCLNERLLILAAKQGLKSSESPPTPTNIINKLIPPRSINYNTSVKTKQSVSSNSLPAKIFALGSLLHRKDLRHHRRRKSDLHDFEDDLDTTSTSLEDESFISIKFGENGVPSWDKGTSNNTTAVSNSKVTLLEHCSMSWGTGQTLVKDNATNNNRDKIGNSHNNKNKSVVEHAKPRVATLRWQKRIGQLLQLIRWRRSVKGNVRGRAVGVENSSSGSNSSCIKGERVMKVGRNEKGWIMRTFKMRTNS